MARIEQGIYALLSGATTITALVSTRISPDRRKKGEALPALVYRVSFSDPIKTLAGPHASMTRSDIQITAFATTRAAVRDIINACAVVLDGYSGETGGVVFRGIIIDGIDTTFYDPAAGENDGVYAATLTVRAMHGSI